MDGFINTNISDISNVTKSSYLDVVLKSIGDVKSILSSTMTANVINNTGLAYALSDTGQITTALNNEASSYSNARYFNTKENVSASVNSFRNAVITNYSSPSSTNTSGSLLQHVKRIRDYNSSVYTLATSSFINETITAHYTYTEGGEPLSNSHNSVFVPSDSGVTLPTTLYTTGNSVSIESSGFSYTEKVIIGCFLSFIIVCAVAGNLLVCIAIFTDRHLRKASNYFYVSLAVADLLVSGVVMTFAVVNDIMGHWVFGSIFCNIWLSSDVMCSTASILNICAISLDRFLHIKDPYNYENTMTPQKTLIFIAILWILSALISFLPIHLGWHETKDYNQYVDGQFICLLDLNPIYAVTSSIVSFFVPCIIMIAIYAKLYLYARRHVKNIKRNSTWSAISTTMLDNHQVAIQQHQYRPSDQKAAITLGVIMGTFLFCWMPFFTINVTTALCSTCVSPLLFNILTWLGYINSMANPIIYPVFNKEFRTAFKRILHCPGSDINNSGDYSDPDYRSHLKVVGKKESAIVAKASNINKGKYKESSSCCYFCCIKLNYTSTQLNGHMHEHHQNGNNHKEQQPVTVNSTSKLNEISSKLLAEDFKSPTRTYSHSPLIEPRVSPSGDIVDANRLDCITVV